MKALHEIALVGTAHLADEAKGALAAGLPSDEFVEALPAEATLERRVLVAAALQSVVVAAGAIPRKDVEPFTVAPAESRPICSPGAAVLLGELISAAPELLREGLGRLVAAGRVVPPALVPDLVATRDETLGTLVAEAIGERGRWFCAVSDQGDWLAAAAAAESDARAAWTEGKHAERLAALVARRRTAPAEARAWIEETWANEKAEHRVEFLEVLDAGLSADDVDFLERGLGDRSVSVRSTVAGLLSRLPSSATAQRLAQRADALLRYEVTAPSGLLSRVKSALGGAARAVLHVDPATAFDAEWEKEGIPAKPPKGLGERAHWLGEVLALVAPAHWEQRFDAAPAELVRAAAQTEWATAVLAGWSRAARRQGDPAWMAALWDGWRELRIDPSLTFELNTRTRFLAELLPRLAPADAERRAVELAASEYADMPLGPITIVEAVPAPWSARFSEDMLRAVRPRAEAATAGSWTSGTWFDALVPMAARLDPSSLAAALAIEETLSARDLTPAFRKRLDEFRQVVHLRHRIHEEIRP